MHDLRADAAFREQVGRAKAETGHHARAKEGHVRPLAHDPALAPLEGVLCPEDVRQGQARDPKVDRTGCLHGGAHDRAKVRVVARVGYLHVGQAAHDRDVLDAVVRGTRPARGQAHVGARDLHVECRVADGDGDLVQRPSRGEDREGRGKRGEALQGEPRGDAEEILLGDAHLDESLGKGLHEQDRLGGRVEVGVQHDDVGPLATEIHERAPEGLAHLQWSTMRRRLTPRHRTSPWRPGPRGASSPPPVDRTVARAPGACCRRWAHPGRGYATWG